MSSSRYNLIDENIKCFCQGYNLDKLIQRQIQIVHANKNLHGYNIIRKLKSKNLSIDDRIDNTGVNRGLKTLEAKEMV